MAAEEESFERIIAVTLRLVGVCTVYKGLYSCSREISRVGVDGVFFHAVLIRMLADNYVGNLTFGLQIPHSTKQVHDLVGPRKISSVSSLGYISTFCNCCTRKVLLRLGTRQHPIYDDSPRLDNRVTSGQLLFSVVGIKGGLQKVFPSLQAISYPLCPMLCLEETAISTADHVHRTKCEGRKKGCISSSPIPEKS